MRRLRAMARPPRTVLGALLRLVFCGLAAFGALLLLWIGTGDDWLHLPHWQAVLAEVGALIAAGVAVWQFVLVLHWRGIRRLVLTVGAVLGILVGGLVLLYMTGGYMGALFLIGVAWLEIIRRTWPKEILRRPRLRTDVLEPPARGRAG